MRSVIRGIIIIADLNVNNNDGMGGYHTEEAQKDSALLLYSVLLYFCLVVDMELLSVKIKSQLISLVFLCRLQIVGSHENNNVQRLSSVYILSICHVVILS